jgi:hypothetical protein
VTGDALIAKELAQVGSTQSEAPKSANGLSASTTLMPSGDDADEETATSGTAPGQLSTGLATAHPKPAKRLNARERQMAKKTGGRNDRDDTKDDAKNGTKPMTAEAKFKAENKAEKAQEKAKQKAAQKAQKAETKASKISAAKAAKAARAA